MDDETLPTFVKKKSTQERKKKKQWAWIKVPANKQAGRKEEREPLSTKTSTNSMKHINKRKRR